MVHTYLKYIPYQTVAYHCDSALPERGTVQAILGVKRAPQQGKADECVQVEDYAAEHSHPHQRLP